MLEVKFDDWWKKHNCVKDSLSYNDAMYVYESRQQEVDKLRCEIDALQKRIDELKVWCISGVECGMLSTTYNQALIDMLKILKGE